MNNERTVLASDSMDFSLPQFSIPYVEGEDREDYLKRYNEMIRQRLIETLQHTIRKVERAPFEPDSPYSLTEVNKMILYLDRSGLDYKFAVRLVKTEDI